MWLPDKDVLSSRTINRQSLLIVQAWHELLTTTTPDSFRARLLDIFLLVDELERTVELARLDARWLSHVVAICEEIDEESGDAIGLLASSPPAVAALNAIASYKEGIGGLPRLSERLRVFKSLVGDVRDLLLKDAFRLASDGCRKADLLRRLGSMATHVQQHGLAEESLENLNESLLTAEPESVVESLCSTLRLGLRTFTCFVAVSTGAEPASAIFANSEFRQVGRKRLEGAETARNWYQDNKDSYLIEFDVSAMSKRLAAELALSKVQTLMNLVVLYANRASHGISPTVLIEHDHRYAAVEVTPSKHFGLLPRRQSIYLARSRFQKMPERLEGRISNILESNALGISSDDPRSAVINLWTALEAIAGSHGASSIGERVAEAISPVVAWRRVDKLVTYLAISMYQLSVHEGRPLDRAHLPSSSDKHVERGDVLACLIGVSRNPGILAVFKGCGSSPLLCYRMFAAWQEFHEPRSIKNALRLSAKRIRWQVLRLYRARNLLVHKGERDELVWRLLENAQYYVSTVIGRILHDMSVQPSWGVDTSLEYQRQKFEHVCERLAEGGGGMTFDDLLLHTPTTRRAVPLWGPNSPFPRSV